MFPGKGDVREKQEKQVWEIRASVIERGEQAFQRQWKETCAEAKRLARARHVGVSQHGKFPAAVRDTSCIASQAFAI